LSKAKISTICYNIELEKQAQALNVQIQDWKGKLEMTKVQLSKPIQVPPIKMHDRVQMTFYEPMCLLCI
jgi:galactose-1-phosphate uridylyltransferase